MKKNDLINVVIEDMSTTGEGIGKTDGFTWFIKDAIIGDVVEAKVMKMKKTYGYARLINILESSPDRVEPKCPVHKQCGGCQIQAMSYEKQLEFKENKIKNNLVRIGGFDKDFIDSITDPIVSSSNNAITFSINGNYLMLNQNNKTVGSIKIDTIY